MFSLDVTAAMLVFRINPLGIELYHHTNVFLRFGENKVTGHVSEGFFFLLKNQIFTACGENVVIATDTISQQKASFLFIVRYLCAVI